MRYRCTTRALCFLILALVSGGSKADDYALLLLEVSLNGQPAHTAFVLRDPDDAFFVEKDVVDAWQADVTASDVISHHGLDFLPLSFFEGTTVAFDPASLSLDVHMPPRHLQSQLRVLREDKSPAPVAGWGSFVDYDLSYLDESGSDSEIFSFFTDASFFGPLVVLTSGQAYLD